MNILPRDQPWDSGGPIIFMSDWWVRAHWGRTFDVLDSQQVQGQTWVLLRKRDVAVSVEDLERPEDDPREVRALRHNVVQVARCERALCGQMLARLQSGYEGSRSWRLTRPLREASRMVDSARARRSERGK